MPHSGTERDLFFVRFNEFFKDRENCGCRVRISYPSFKSCTIDTLATVRDIFLIVAAGLFIVVVLAGGVMAFRLYRLVRSSVRNMEEFSRKVVRPLSNIVEKAGPVIRFVQTLRSGERRSEDE